MARAGAAVTEAADRRLQNTTRRNIEMLVVGGSRFPGCFLEVGHILTEMASDVLRSGVETAQDLSTLSQCWRHCPSAGGVDPSQLRDFLQPRS